MKPEAVLLDVDGTLVDSNYEHTRAWYRALREWGLLFPQARIHRGIGMGSDQLLPYLTGWQRDDPRLKGLADARAELYRSEYLPQIRPLPGATAFVRRLKEAGYRICLASSAKEEEVVHYTRLLELEGLLDATTSHADVEATKPEPELFRVACEKLRVSPGVVLVVGDSVWDGEAAARAGMRFVGLETGGFSAAELKEAGALAVYAELPELLECWEDSPFAGRF